MSDLHLIRQKTIIRKEDRFRLNEHSSCVLWFTGLSGSGKSTLAHRVEEALYKEKVHTYVLDGDNIRLGLNSNLSFSAEDRSENIRRIGEVAKLFTDAGILVLTAFISPFREDRDRVRNLLQKDEFIEVFVDCSLEVCEARDVKGLYQKARSGKIKQFTGIDSPYEPPINPEIIVQTDKQSLDESVAVIMSYLKEYHYIKAVDSME